MSGVVWEEPGPPNATRGPEPKLQAEATALKSRPGEWARIADLTAFSGDTASARAGNIRNAMLAAFRPKGAFEAVTRKLDDGSYGVYARYVGEAKS